MKLCERHRFDYESPCCKDLKTYIYEYRFYLDYRYEDNSYFIPFVWPNRDIVILSYCPFCGTKLPEETDREFVE